MSVPQRRRPDAPERPRLRRILDRVEAVPALPDVINRILSLVDDPDASANVLAEEVARDQSMVSSILKMVNSPFYGLSGRVTSIQHAVVLLGFRTIRNIALSSVLMKIFGEADRDARFDRGGLWRHTISSAVGSRMLASRLRSAEPEEAFLAGLLHDMGIVILDQYFHAEFRRALSFVTARAWTLRQAEREVFGHDHAAVGGLLARKWHFPMAVCEAIACHHQPSRARRAPVLAALVHLSNHLPESGGDDPPSAWETDPLEPDAFEIARVPPESFPDLQAAYAQEWARAQVFLSLVS